MIQPPSICKLLQWSEPKTIRTRSGPRKVRTAWPTEKFWEVWHEHKEQLRTAGISMHKDPDDGEWKITWWLPNEEAAAAIEQSRAQDADIEVPTPKGLELLPYQRAGIAYALRILGIEPPKG